MILGYVSSFYHVLFALAWVGALQGASWVPATKLLAKWYTDGSYGKMFSILGCGSTTAGFATLIYSIVIYLCLRGDDVTPLTANKGKSSNILTFIWSPVIWSVAVNYLFTMEVRTICETWIPLYINENGIDLATFQVLYEIGGILGNIGSGALLDHLCLRISVDSARRIVGLGSTTLLLLTAAYSIKYLVRFSIRIF
ncbi:unnamed protein product [Cylicostephanus goldi]|uniref:Major facilitator superfamily (MFS) profile domain-containing protein n=1 Tax=Cylicostephanus goldi TaxID=71465 RepID=A0A3P7QDP7_CYLGO|nr:unnamed protein product [Cylicostephanus goldi]